MQHLVESGALERVKKLIFIENPLGDAGVRVLAESAAVGRVTLLNLDRVELTDVGARSLFLSPHLSGLNDLDLSSNRITPASLRLLTDPSRLPTLRYLSIDKGVLDAATRQAILAARPALTIGEFRDPYPPEGPLPARAPRRVCPRKASTTAPAHAN